MRTQNPRINITLESAAAGLLRHLAHKEHKSVAGLARELIVESLERREDVALSALARLRDTPHAKRVKHDDAWR
ncbi:MAG: hypothetical protein AAF471_05725 [Myxococcota bacterium]